ncbi:MAG: HD domain-containing protein [Spirochaetes bacterium]|jgi:HD-GYP domain-containing protein (c-di-GMP phosphodiesterase class II)|nr:HD domain-containing protein [Spirochaetota bacterium]
MSKSKSPECLDLENLLGITEELNHIKDIDSLLDHILHNARQFCKAEAGSIFLREKDHLIFSYVQNDMLVKREKNYNKRIYDKFTIPINRESIAGYVADTGKALKIDDVYIINDTVPYSFNSSFDEMSSYRTKSILTIPLITSRDNITGVIQIINPQLGDDVTIFTDLHSQYVTFLANNASVAIERAQMTREIILRMIRMAELRDPKETGAHVNRVGAYSIEIYQRIAQKRGDSPETIRHTKDHLRIAAMLHDVGKVAISDSILKKPARLDDDEFTIMQTHCASGADLFDGNVSELDLLSARIALTHHEKFDGSGYPNALEGGQIPLPGRIVALADVYDALISKRVYKEEWPDEEVLKYITDQSGIHFDPEVVEAFFDVHEVLKAVGKRYPD